MRANNGGGSTLANGGTLWTFSISATPLNQFSYLPLIVRPYGPPAAFGKIQPGQRLDRRVTSPDFSWAASTGATSYDFCYDASVNGDCTGGWTTTGSSTTWSLSGLPYSTTFEWQVRANNQSGIPTYADAGTEWSFTTMAAPVPWTTVTSENFETAIPKAGWSVADGSSSDGGDLYHRQAKLQRP